MFHVAIVPIITRYYVDIGFVNVMKSGLLCGKTKFLFAKPIDINFNALYGSCLRSSQKRKFRPLSVTLAQRRFRDFIGFSSLVNLLRYVGFLCR